MPRPSNLSPDNILRFLQVTRDPASANEIGAALHIGKTDRKPLFKMLVTLKKRGAIKELPGGRYRLAGRKSAGEPGGMAARLTVGGVKGAGYTRNVQREAGSHSLARDEVRGRLVLHHDGYGFVVPDVPMPQLDGDVFIPRDAVEDAMHGDRVLAKLQRVSEFRGGGQRAEGRIVRAGAGASFGRGIVSLRAARKCRAAL